MLFVSVMHSCVMKSIGSGNMSDEDEPGQIPSWREAKGTRVRVALWLATKVSRGWNF